MTRIDRFATYDEWLAERRARPWIGGSTAADIWGRGYSSPYALFAEMAGLIETDTTCSYRMRRGQLMEPVVGELFKGKTGIAIQAPEFEVRRTDHAPWFACTPDFDCWIPDGLDPFDGLCDSFGNMPPFPLNEMGAANPGVLQVKTIAGWFSRDLWERKPPLNYAIQVMHEMMACDVQWGILAVDFGDDCRWAWYSRDARFENLHTHKCGLFWEAVQAKEWSGEVDRSQATYDALRERWQENREGGSELALTSDSTKWVTMYDKGTRMEKEGKAAKAMARNNLVSAMAKFEVARTPSGRRLSLTANKNGASTFRVGPKKK
jgi:predicted phage-related endonuclease